MLWPKKRQHLPLAAVLLLSAIDVLAGWPRDLAKVIKILGWDQPKHIMGLLGRQLPAVNKLANPLPCQSEYFARLGDGVELVGNHS
jgi:hypothetical protein